MSRNSKFISSMFKLYVRPHMEYCAELWNQEFQEDYNKMERVQNKMTRLLRDSGVRSPEDRNNLLGVTSHKTRRLRGDLINMFKYIEKDTLTCLNTSKKISSSPCVKIVEHEETTKNLYDQIIIRQSSVILFLIEV